MFLLAFVTIGVLTHVVYFVVNVLPSSHAANVTVCTNNECFMLYILVVLGSESHLDAYDPESKSDTWLQGPWVNI